MSRSTKKLILGIVIGVFASMATPGRPRKRWELVGRKAYGDESFERVPPWVRREIARIYRGATSSLGEEVHYLKGKTYRYKLVFGGQGGPILGVFRRRRRRKRYEQT